MLTTISKILIVGQAIVITLLTIALSNANQQIKEYDKIIRRWSK